MDTFADIDNVIRTNLQTFKKPGALTVRPGYKIAAGWITKTPAIVVTVDRKRLAVAAADMIPSKVGIYPTDVREATQLQKLCHANASMYATVVATARPEFAQPSRESADRGTGWRSEGDSNPRDLSRPRRRRMP
jgi:hypothetical protein